MGTRRALRMLPGRRPAASRPQQGQLDEILSVLPVAGQQEGEAQQPPAVAGREGLELCLVPARHGLTFSSSPHLRSNDTRDPRVVPKVRGASDIAEPTTACGQVVDQECGWPMRRRLPLKQPGQRPSWVS
jgi:hypothetical protein